MDGELFFPLIIMFRSSFVTIWARAWCNQSKEKNSSPPKGHHFSKRLPKELFWLHFFSQCSLDTPPQEIHGKLLALLFTFREPVHVQRGLKIETVVPMVLIWVFTDTNSFWKGAQAVIDIKCPTFFDEMKSESDVKFFFYCLYITTCYKHNGKYSLKTVHSAYIKIT